MKKKILITGASGMLGKSLIRIINKKNINLLTPSSKKLDLLDKNSIDKYLKKNKPNYVIHLAGYIGGIEANINEPVNFLQENILMGINLVKSCCAFKIKNFLNIGSSCIYPTNFKHALKEEKLFDGKVETTNEGYAIAKIAVIKICEYVSKELKFNYFSLIPCNIYGPHDKFDLGKAKVIPALINKIFRSKHKIEVWGDGKDIKDFIYVEDFIDATLKIITKQNKIFDIFNISQGNSITLNKVIMCLKKITNKKNLIIKYNKTKPTMIPIRKISSKKINKMWKPKHSLLSGLTKTYDWYSKQNS